MSALPPIGMYWSRGVIRVGRMDSANEAYATCARCGAFVNAEDRHDAWHQAVEDNDE